MMGLIFPIPDLNAVKKSSLICKDGLKNDLVGMQLPVGDALLELVIARLGRRQLLYERRNRGGRASRQLAHRRRVVDLFHHDSRRRSRRSRVHVVVDYRLYGGAEIPRRRLPPPFWSAQSAVEIGNLLGAQCRIVRFRRKCGFQSALSLREESRHSYSPQ